jgi:hypothetical protein
VAERSLLAGLRPLLLPSKLDDPPLKIGFVDDRWFLAPGIVDLLYGDHEGGQRVITRFALRSRADGEGWTATAARHWNIDRDDPR